MNPGAVYPGMVGAICLLVGLYAFAALPMNYAGLALLMLGIGLMVAELFTPSLGILGIGGVIAFVLGAAILFDTDMPQFRLAWPVIGGLAVVSRSEEHTSELQSLMHNSYAVFCLEKKHI